MSLTVYFVLRLRHLCAATFPTQLFFSSELAIDRHLFRNTQPPTTYLKTHHFFGFWTAYTASSSKPAATGTANPSLPLLLRTHFSHHSSTHSPFRCPSSERRFPSQSTAEMSPTFLTLIELLPDSTRPVRSHRSILGHKSRIAGAFSLLLPPCTAPLHHVFLPLRLPVGSQSEHSLL